MWYEYNSTWLYFFFKQIVCLAIAGCASAGLLPYQQKYQQPHQQQYHHPVTHNVHVPVTHHVGGGVDAAAPILRSTSDISPDGHYSYEYETGNGIHAQEAGLASHSVQGSFGYTAPDGTPIQISYIADENGLYWFLQYLSIRKSLLFLLFQFNWNCSLFMHRLPTKRSSFASWSTNTCSCFAPSRMERSSSWTKWWTTLQQTISRSRPIQCSSYARSCSLQYTSASCPAIQCIPSAQILNKILINVYDCEWNKEVWSLFNNKHFVFIL